MGVVRRDQNRLDEAENEFEAAIRLNPNLHVAHLGLGFTKATSGRGEEALQHLTNSIRLSPRDPYLFYGYFGIRWVRFLLGDDDRAIGMLRKALALSPNYPTAHLNSCRRLRYAGPHRRGECSARRLPGNRRDGQHDCTPACTFTFNPPSRNPAQPGLRRLAQGREAGAISVSLKLTMTGKVVVITGGASGIGAFDGPRFCARRR